MVSSARDLLSYVDASPTPYHAVAETCRRMEAAGFSALAEGDAWTDLAPGSRHFVQRGGGSLLAFELGAQPPSEAGFRIVGAHTDSPNLRIKPRADFKSSGCRQLGVEPYGSLLLHTWLDRDLSLAGRVFLGGDAGGLPTSHLVDFRRPLLRIPNLAIHLQRELRQEGLKLNPQRHLVPVIGLESAPELAAQLAVELRKAGVETTAEAITGFDLMLYDPQPSSLWGAEEEFLAAPRIDNLASCHAGITALLRAVEGGPAAYSRAVVLNDHEEVGSRSATGAAGPFLADVLGRLAAGAAGSPSTPAVDALPRALAHSWMISADMAHAVHPNYAERHEPRHRPVLGAGPVLKMNSNQSYATDGEGISFFAGLCKQVGVAPQHFVTRSDLGCGSTIGPITAAELGLRTIDVGNPMLAMHSCRETAAAADVEPMIAVLSAYFGS